MADIKISAMTAASGLTGAELVAGVQSGISVNITAANMLVQTQGTVTANSPMLNLSQTWNNAAVTFKGAVITITNTASASNSKILDVKSGNSSYLYVRVDGLVVTGNAFGWDQLGGADLFLYRDAANILAQRNSTTAQCLRVFNTYTDASNYERGIIDWTTNANILTIGVQVLGTGTSRNMVLTAWTKAGAPTTSDIPAGTWSLVRDSSGATTKLYYNNAGTLMSVALT